MLVYGFESLPEPVYIDNHIPSPLNAYVKAAYTVNDLLLRKRELKYQGDGNKRVTTKEHVHCIKRCRDLLDLHSFCEQLKNVHGWRDEVKAIHEEVREDQMSGELRPVERVRSVDRAVTSMEN